MAATKMLTQLLRADNIAYTIRPVSNFDEVKVVVQTNMTADIKSVFLINCGAVSLILALKLFQLLISSINYRYMIFQNVLT